MRQWLALETLHVLSAIKGSLSLVLKVSKATRSLNLGTLRTCVDSFKIFPLYSDEEDTRVPTVRQLGPM